MSGMLGAALRGAASGAALGYIQVEKEHDEKEAEQLKQQAEIEKEKRIEEESIRKENRGMERDIAMKQADIDINTDPANIEKAARAKVAGQSIQDEYTYANMGKEAEREGLLARAKHIESPDRTDYEGRRLLNEGRAISNKQRQFELDNPYSPQAKGHNKMSDVDKYQLRLLTNEMDDIQNKIDEGLEDDADNRLGEIRDEIQAILKRNGMQSTETESRIDEGGAIEDILKVRERIEAGKAAMFPEEDSQPKVDKKKLKATEAR